MVPYTLISGPLKSLKFSNFNFKSLKFDDSDQLQIESTVSKWSTWFLSTWFINLIYDQNHVIFVQNNGQISKEFVAVVIVIVVVVMIVVVGECSNRLEWKKLEMADNIGIVMVWMKLATCFKQMEW